MNRIDRLVGILTTLQSRRHSSAEFLSDKYQISTRTVYRDIKALGEVGVPIGLEPQQGYFIVQGYFLAPISLTTEEANALILMTALADKFADKPTSKATQSAIEKIKSVLNGSDKEKVDLLHSNVRVYAPDAENPGDTLGIIQSSIVNKQVLTIEYTNNQGEASKREIEPIGLTFYSNQWHVIAWCWNRVAYRDFKVLQIRNLKENGESFRKREHWDINEYICSLE